MSKEFYYHTISISILKKITLEIKFHYSIRGFFASAKTSSAARLTVRKKK